MSASYHDWEGNLDETRRRLIAAAGFAIDRDGYDGTDTNRIAREAGYSPEPHREWVAEEWRTIERLFERTNKLTTRLVTP